MSELVNISNYNPETIPDGKIQLAYAGEELLDIYQSDFVPGILFRGSYTEGGYLYNYIVYSPQLGIPLDRYVKLPVSVNFDNLSRELTTLFLKIRKDGYDIGDLSLHDLNIHNGKILINNLLALRELYDDEDSDGYRSEDFNKRIFNEIERNASKEFILQNRNHIYSRENLSRNVDLIHSWPEIVLPNAPIQLQEHWETAPISYNLPKSFILAHPDLRLDRATLSRRSDFMMEDTNLELPNSVGVWEPFTLNKNRVSKDEHIDRARAYGVGRYHVAGMSLPDVEYPGSLGNILTIEQILAHPEVEWSRHILSRNPEITMDIMRRIDMLPNVGGNWIYSFLSQNLPMDDIRSNPSLLWNRAYLSQNPTITVNDVQELNLPNAFGDWDWKQLSQTLHMDEIRANPHLPWRPEYLIRNPEITRYER